MDWLPNGKPRAVLKLVAAILPAIVVISGALFVSSQFGNMSKWVILLMATVMLVVTFYAYFEFESDRRVELIERRMDELTHAVALETMDICLPKKSHGWASEKVLLAAGEFMDALGYDYVPETEDVGVLNAAH